MPTAARSRRPRPSRGCRSRARMRRRHDLPARRECVVRVGLVVDAFLDRPAAVRHEALGAGGRRSPAVGTGTFQTTVRTSCVGRPAVPGVSLPKLQTQSRAGRSSPPLREPSDTTTLTKLAVIVELPTTRRRHPHPEGNVSERATADVRERRPVGDFLAVASTRPGPGSASKESLGGSIPLRRPLRRDRRRNRRQTHEREPHPRCFHPHPSILTASRQPAELVIATLQSHGVGTAHRDNHARRPPHRPDIPISSENHTRSVTRHAMRRLIIARRGPRASGRARGAASSRREAGRPRRGYDASLRATWPSG